VPVAHHDLVLQRQEFRRPGFGIGIEGLDGLDAYFGLDW
jgi:hypothetical protein